MPILLTWKKSAEQTKTYPHRSHPWKNKRYKEQGWNKYNMQCVTMADATHSVINHDMYRLLWQKTHSLWIASTWGPL